jgi:F-type H+-transporting ATPase subunit b
MKKLSLVVFATVLMGFCATAFAADAEHGSGGFPVGEVIAAVINFVLFVWILIKVGKKGVSGFYQQRADQLNEAIEKAQEALTKATALNEEASKRLAEADKEANALVDGARQAADKHAKNLVASAETAANRILSDAKATIETESKRMTSELKAELAAKVVEMARSEIQSKLDDSGHRALVQDYLTKVDQVEDM